MNPIEVISPKKYIKNLKIIFENSIFSIAAMSWKDEPRVGMRWNGSGESLGYPTSRAKSTWFIIPKEIALSYAKTVGDVKMEEAIKATTDKPFIE